MGWQTFQFRIIDLSQILSISKAESTCLPEADRKKRRHGANPEGSNSQPPPKTEYSEAPPDDSQAPEETQLFSEEEFHPPECATEKPNKGDGEVLAEEMGEEEPKTDDEMCETVVPHTAVTYPEEPSDGNDKDKTNSVSVKDDDVKVCVELSDDEKDPSKAKGTFKDTS